MTNDPATFTFGGVTYTAKLDPATYTAGQTQKFILEPATGVASTLNFNPATGKFDSVSANGVGEAEIKANPKLKNALKLDKLGTSSGEFKDVFVDFSTLTQFAANGRFGVLQTTGSYSVSGDTTKLELSKDTKAILPKYTAGMRYIGIGNANDPNAFNVVNKLTTQPWAMHKIL